MSNVKKPKLIVFDLDYTLWPFWVDTHVDPPFHKDKNGLVLDSCNRKVTCYKEVPEVLDSLYNEGYMLGIASRTGEIAGAKLLLRLFNWDKYFMYKVIYPGSKVNHFKKFKALSHLDYSEMMFFDDEHRNIEDVKKLGVWTVYVENGVTRELVKSALHEYSK